MDEDLLILYIERKEKKDFEFPSTWKKRRRKDMDKVFALLILVLPPEDE